MSPATMASATKLQTTSQCFLPTPVWTSDFARNSIVLELWIMYSSTSGNLYGPTSSALTSPPGAIPPCVWQAVSAFRPRILAARISYIGKSWTARVLHPWSAYTFPSEYQLTATQPYNFLFWHVIPALSFYLWWGSSLWSMDDDFYPIRLWRYVIQNMVFSFTAMFAQIFRSLAVNTIHSMRNWR